MGERLMSQVNADERAEWEALANADTLQMLPKEALVASIKLLAERLLQVTDGEVPEVEVTSNLPVPTNVAPLQRRSGAKNVSSAHLQNAFISEARTAMGQPDEEEAVRAVGRVVKITFNVDKPPVSGKLTRVINHPSSAPTYVILDDDDNVLYPLNSIQSIEVIE